MTCLVDDICNSLIQWISVVMVSVPGKLLVAFCLREQWAKPYPKSVPSPWGEGGFGGLAPKTKLQAHLS